MANFWDLVNIEEFWEKRITFEPERWEVSFYCKDCSKIVSTQRKKPQSYKFICEVCGGENIAIGTHEGLKDNYKIKK